MPSTLITGGNRGLGLEFARQYAGDGWRVYATGCDPGSASDLPYQQSRTPFLDKLVGDLGFGCQSHPTLGDAPKRVACDLGARSKNRFEAMSGVPAARFLGCFQPARCPVETVDRGTIATPTRAALSRP